MNSGIGEQLREGIDRATTGEQLDPSLTARARQRHRRRAITIRAAALTGTAAVAAVATFAATAGTGATQPGGTLPARTSAYIFSHTEAALAAAGRGTLIMRAAVKPPPLGGLAVVAFGGTRHHRFFLRLSSLPIQDTVSWLYHGRTRTQGFTPSGQLAIETGPSAATRATGPQPPAAGTRAAAADRGRRWLSRAPGDPFAETDHAAAGRARSHTGRGPEAGLGLHRDGLLLAYAHPEKLGTG